MREAGGSDAPTASVAIGDIVLCRLGHKYWPALCVDLTGCAPRPPPRADPDDAIAESAGTTPAKVHLIFFGDHKELTTSALSARHALRPFAHIVRLSTRETPTCRTYAAALREAHHWQCYMAAAVATATATTRPGGSEGDRCDDSHAAAASAGADDEGRWSINGETVPLSLLMRANARRLPSWHRGPTATTTTTTPHLPTGTFRVIDADPVATARAAIARTAATAGSRGATATVPAGAKDSTFARRHAGLEQLERRGYAAHPDLVRDDLGRGAEHARCREDMEEGTRPSLEMKRQGGDEPRPPSTSRKRGRGAAGSSTPRVEDLLGRKVRVPARAFPGFEAPVAAAHYTGTIARCIPRRRGGESDALEVYFASDNTTCIFSVEQALYWLIPPRKKVLARSNKRSRPRAPPNRHTSPARAPFRAADGATAETAAVLQDEHAMAAAPPHADPRGAPRPPRRPRLAAPCATPTGALSSCSAARDRPRRVGAGLQRETSYLHVVVRLAGSFPSIHEDVHEA